MHQRRFDTGCHKRFLLLTMVRIASKSTPSLTVLAAV